MTADIGKKRIFALVWRLLGLGIGIYGSVVMFGMSLGSTMLVYFTMQTNLFVLAMFAVLAVMTAVQIARDGAEGEVAHLNCSLELAVTFYITITFVVYWTLLSWQNFGMSGTDAAVEFTVSNYIVHGIVPIFAIVDWILFLPHGRVARSAPLKWLAYPVIYAIFIFIRAEVGGVLYSNAQYTSRYPYPFIDVDLIGGWVAAVVPVMAAAFYGLGRLYVLADMKIASRLSRSVPEYIRLARYSELT